MAFEALQRICKGGVVRVEGAMGIEVVEAPKAVERMHPPSIVLNQDQCRQLYLDARSSLKPENCSAVLCSLCQIPGFIESNPTILRDAIEQEYPLLIIAIWAKMARDIQVERYAVRQADLVGKAFDEAVLARVMKCCGLDAKGITKIITDKQADPSHRFGDEMLRVIPLISPLTIIEYSQEEQKEN